MRTSAAWVLIVAALSSSAQAQEPVRLYAAGSLRAVMTEIGDAFTRSSGTKVAGTFGASGLLAERIRNGEPAEIFASANMEHPRALQASGRWGETRRFTRNRMCALAAPKVRVTADNLLDGMLDPRTKLGTSTPKADPSGDYALEVFEKAEHVRPGASVALKAKALQLTGGPGSPPPPQGRNVYGMLVANGNADIFLTYCTNAVLAMRESPALQMVQLPAALAVGADYGLAVATASRAEAARFADFVLSRAGQDILARHGFDAGE
jgi:molybdate transport system substrate-binding protein